MRRKKRLSNVTICGRSATLEVGGKSEVIKSGVTRVRRGKVMRKAKRNENAEGSRGKSLKVDWVRGREDPWRGGEMSVEDPVVAEILGSWKGESETSGGRSFAS